MMPSTPHSLFRKGWTGNRMGKFIFLMAASALFGFSAPVGAESPGESAGLAPAAPEFALPDLRGKTYRLSKFRGRVVLLDFWATWCGPCRMSTPALVELKAKMKGKKFTIIGVSVDETKEGVKDFADSMGVDHLILWAGGTTINETYQIRGIPSFYLIDRQGRIRKHYPGYAPGMEADWERSVNYLLSEKQ